MLAVVEDQQRLGHAEVLDDVRHRVLLARRDAERIRHRRTDAPPLQERS